MVGIQDTKVNTQHERTANMLGALRLPWKASEITIKASPPWLIQQVRYQINAVYRSTSTNLLHSKKIWQHANCNWEHSLAIPIWYTQAGRNVIPKLCVGATANCGVNSWSPDPDLSFLSSSSAISPSQWMITTPESHDFGMLIGSVSSLIRRTTWISTCDWFEYWRSKSISIHLQPNISSFRILIFAETHSTRI